MQKYQKEFEVHYYEVDVYQELTLPALLDYLEETAIAHSEAVGYGITRLKERGYGWVLNRWQIEIIHYPHRGDRIKVQTWMSNSKRFYAEREFLVLSAENEVIAQANSLWIFLNLEKRRPHRIPQEIQEAYSLVPEKVQLLPFPDFNDNHSGQTEECEFMVRRSDIDTNAHVNNVKYIEWLLETIPEDVYRTSKISSLEVIYKKESTYGQIIHAFTEEQQKTEQRVYYDHQIHKQEGENKVVLALAKTFWSKQKII
ncbi:acyl-[acyl-carrier-protein] thioesterase [Desulfitobacterium sp.]|uniref:Acyl-ACP thioesterase n=1 Tax=bioreactor metagenome TaxID=1076179 RepID=A0A645CJ60_9ZZZZ|nr:acyl-ACP thioesterase domain-containing protein [Desulfitobacterium sp.]MEA4901106.1 thioesterase [Desulfitobacterium sp.]